LDTLTHDEKTLVKVYEALEAAGISSDVAVDAVTEMQNRGILFHMKGL
jgi:hypothetical protein